MRPRRLSGLAALCLVVLAAPVEATTPFPVGSLGDIWFQVDHAGFLDPDRNGVEEFYVRINNNQLRFEPEEGGWAARVFIRLDYLDEEEDKLGEASRRFEYFVPDEASALSADAAQILLMRESIDPRTRMVRVAVDDMNARKRGLLYLVTGKRRSGEAVGTLAAPPFAAGEDFTASDLQFAWMVGEARAGSDFEKNGLDVVPNPGRAYGLLQPEASVYFEVYDHSAEGAAGTAYGIRHRVSAPDGQVMTAGIDTVTAPGGDWAHVLRFDVTRFAAGQYSLRVEVERLRDGALAATERGFGVVWGLDAWGRSEEDILDEARVLFSEDEFNRFVEMSSADREVFLAQFWLDHDPTPMEPGNEVRDEFVRRVRYANDQFRAHGKKGMLTDRGRLYIRYGEPDEIERELMPTRDRQLDRIAPDLLEENPRARTLETSDEIDVRPFEIWIYARRGIPLFPEREFGTSLTGLRFIFIDETGTGNYVLRYSKDFIDY